MKKFQNLTVIGILFFAASCQDDFLEIAPRDQLSERTYWQSEQDAKLALIGIYDLWGGQGNGDDGFPYSFFLFFADSWSDDAYNQFGGWYEDFAQGNISPANGNLAARYAEMYQIIRRCNVFLANIDRPVMDETARAIMLAEVKFIRAFQYFLLYYHWGEAQIVDKPISPEEQNIPRGRQGETVAFILEDLQESIAGLPLNQTEEGRIDRGAAMGLKVRVLLYEASPLSNPSNDISKWQDAADAAKALIDLGRYQLFTTSKGDGYAQLFDTEHENNAEVIIDRENEAIPNHGNQMIRLLSTNPSSTTFLVPTQSLVDAYDAYDPATDQLTSISPLNPFLNRDPRLDYTIGHEGSEFYGTPLSLNASPLIKSTTGYSIHKFLTDEFNPFDANNGGRDSPVNHILMRYAEVLLSYAEARIESGTIDQSVLNAINQVRARAYGVDVSDTDQYPEITATGQSILREIVQKERRVELALEGLRWYDIRRWQTAEIVRNETLSGALGDIIERQFDARRDYLWPVPQREIDLIGAEVLQQNEGY